MHSVMKGLFVLLFVFSETTTLLVVASSISYSRIPRNNFGIRTESRQHHEAIYTSNRKNVRKVETANREPARGGASVVVAAGAAKTMSANQYKLLK